MNSSAGLSLSTCKVGRKVGDAHKIRGSSGLDVCASQYSTSNLHQNSGLLLHAPISCVALATLFSFFETQVTKKGGAPSFQVLIQLGGPKL